MYIVIKHLFWMSSLILAFCLSGTIGLFCENWHADLAMSTGAFGVSFAGMTGLSFKVYLFLFN